MSPGSSTESYPAFARIGLRENPGKNLNQVTCPDRDSNPGHLVSRPDALTVTPQMSFFLGLALRNARWFESSWGKKFSHEISASVWDRSPPSIVMHLGSYDSGNNDDEQEEEKKEKTKTRGKNDDDY
ncbi:hypothetical protein ANN_01674 [Periplaneta americana]|uniref:Uncharacterized protein n=1 Tax=Periplaneta americana TaxID=6978 RepID=A0ABQ8TYA7_PERAM|nr:hypothetical protein ANN_01674 [Periplaneta americana]